VIIKTASGVSPRGVTQALKYCIWLDVFGSIKHASLFQRGLDCDGKKFYCTCSVIHHFTHHNYFLSLVLNEALYHHDV
jgi:hypothetical protein